MEYKVESWLSDSEISEIAYSEYWNDEEQEKSKEWYVLDGNFSKMEHYLKKSNMVEDLIKAVDVSKKHFISELRGVGIDLAAGNLWAVPHLLNLGAIEKIYCLEYSKHRLFKIGPRVLEHYNVPKYKVVLVLGSFYDLHLENNSLDFVLLSQAFHHANEPLRILAEIERTLKPSGIVIIIGENIVNLYKAYLRYFIKFFISMFMPVKFQKRLFKKTFQPKRLVPKSKDLFLPDPVLGDHNYTNKQYYEMFSKFQFQIKNIKSRNPKKQSFVLQKRAS